MHIAICDDDTTISRSLRDMLLDVAGQHICEIHLFSDGNRLLFELDECSFDLFFMDIELNHESGITLSGEILKRNTNAQIIFVSGFDKYYLDVYDVEHLYFLKKPINEDKLLDAVLRAKEKKQILQSHFLTILNKQGITKIPLDQIIFLEKDRRLISVYQCNEQVNKFYGKFVEIQDQLGGNFVQCHGSYMVNLCHVRHIDSQDLQMDNQAIIPISRGFAKSTREAFLTYLEKSL